MKLFVKILSLFCLLAFCHIAEAQMQWKTVAVGDSGSVTLQWHWVAPPSGSSLVLYYATRPAGPYVPVDTLAVSDTVCVHRNANAAAGVRYYFFVSGSWKYDTVVTLYMGMENIGGGVANLAWNRPTLQMINDMPTYTLYRRGFGRDSVRVTGYSYRDTVTVCGDTLEYVLVLDLPKSAGNPCIRYISPVCRDYFSDFTAPDTARLDSVSLRPESRCCEIGWQPSKSKDVYGYIVYIYKDGIWKVMDTLHGASNTFYADTLHADGSVHEYRIASLDTCRNASPLGEIHHTMVLSATPNKCDSAVSLSWNAYAHMPGGAASFEVFARSGKDGFQCIGSGGKGSSFRCEGLDVMRPYTFYVRVWNADRSISATSSTVDVDFHRKPGSGVALLRSVSVTEDNDILVTAHVPDTADYRSLVLCRHLEPDGPAVWSDTLAKCSGNCSWRQRGLDVQQPHYYTVSLTDECNMAFYVSEPVANIVLHMDMDVEANRLSWSSYDGFRALPDSYRVYRRAGTLSPFALLDDRPFPLRGYDDPLQDLPSGNEIAYRVSAVGHVKGLPDTVECFSNTVVMEDEPAIYIPNSFIPESDIEENRVFRPVLHSVPAPEYLLTIFDRWGQVVFETRNPEEGWDGLIKGLPARMGVYVFQLSFRMKNNKLYTRRGMVNLIR
jgi:gliding motility-associated-like protein